ncbi:sugar-binding protein, partial [Pseudomonas umsongensis]|nr:sugar-binding protein [Pseudomonas umsongensis]
MTTSATNSQACSFMSFLQGGVDPRTGQYTLSINLPELQCNELSGPAVPVGLNFNPLNTEDSGYGLGFNFNLSQFNSDTHILALSTGETFKVTGSGQKPDIKEQKLDSFHFEDNQDGTYRVVHKSGQVETLELGSSSQDPVALPRRIQSPTGHSVTLNYVGFRGGRRLESISDAQGKALLQIKRPPENESLIELLLYPYDGPQGGPLARYQLKLNGSDWVTEIMLPTEVGGSWRLGYGGGLINGILCLHDVKTPVGGHETIEYLDAGHPFPVYMQRPNLPRVTRHCSYPGSGQPMMETIYDYNHLGNSYNFLGFGTSTPVEVGLDTLYLAPASYVYG